MNLLFRKTGCILVLNQKIVFSCYISAKRKSKLLLLINELDVDFADRRLYL